MSQQQFNKINNHIISFLTRNAEMIYMRLSRDSAVKNIYKAIDSGISKLETSIRKAI